METDEMLKKRFLELADKAYQSSQYLFTGFLGLNEIDLFYQIEKQISYVGYTMFGGMEGAERQMIRFGSQEMWGYEEEFPIVCVEVKPLIQKFADALSHRDFLGALMNIGIERTTIGDIVVTENVGYVFCTQTIAPFIMEQLDKVKHTHVKCSVAQTIPEACQAQMVETMLQLSSERIDGIIAKAYKLSRAESIELFRQKLVFVNGRLCENNSYTVKEQDAITARGYGKLIYQGTKGTSKKGKLQASILQYSK